jgi:hypothetical protein
VKITKERNFTVNMGNFESMRFGASVELDSKELTGEPTAGQMYAMADEMIAEALAADVKTAGELTNTTDSFILSIGS